MSYPSDDKIRRLIEAFGTYYSQTIGTLAQNATQQNVVSEALNVVSSFGEKGEGTNALFGIPTLCDEFIVQVGYDDFSSLTAPTFDTTLLNAYWMEYLTPKQATAQGSNQSWAVCDMPTSFDVQMNNGYGRSSRFFPGQRTIRFHARYTLSAVGTPASQFIMGIVGRMNNGAALRLLLQAINERIVNLGDLLRRADQRMSELEVQTSRFDRRVDPSNPLLVPSIMRR